MKSPILLSQPVLDTVHRNCIVSTRTEIQLHLLGMQKKEIVRQISEVTYLLFYYLSHQNAGNSVCVDEKS